MASAQARYAKPTEEEGRKEEETKRMERMKRRKGRKEEWGMGNG
jgi:hypothetical protein